MTAVTNLNTDLFNEKLNEGDYSFCTQLLKDEFKLIKNEENKLIPKTPSESCVNTLGNLLEKLTPDLQNETVKEDKLLLVQQCYQSLRNCSACGENIQNLIAKNTNIMSNTSKLIEFLVEKREKSCTDCLKMLLQFLSNLVVNNTNVQTIVLEKFFKTLNSSLFHTEVAHIVTIILYNLLKNNPTIIENDVDFASNVLMLCSVDVENMILILELLVSKNIIPNIYNKLDSENRVSLLEYIHVMQSQENIELSSDLIKLMCEEFKKKSDCILKTVTDYLSSIEPLEVARLLDCLATASSNEKFLIEMQNDKSLLINCVYLLKSIHSAGKEGNNEFTAIQKLSEQKADDPTIISHPAFGFKASLIRVIGNLSWKHENNQNLVRELECIPLLMDCCNIDARNPLIIQWVILAVRNLCENNDGNKEVIASLTKLGVVDSATLREMGLTLNDDGSNKICIVPLDNLNK